MPSMSSTRYDKLHMTDLPSNRTLMIKFMRSMIRAHLIVTQIEELEPILRQKASFLDSDPEERMKIVYQYPNLAQFKFALSKTDQVQAALTQAALPVSLAQEAQTADEHLMDYMAELNEVAEDEATREGAPQPVEFTESDLKSIVPVFKDDVDSDEEEARLREHLQADFDDAADADWSSVHSEATENIPGIDEWEAIDDSRPDIVHNIFDREDNVESHTEVDYGADHEETVEQVDEFADAIVIQDDAMDVDKNEAETKDDAGALDDVMVIEEPETGHPAVEVTTEESKAPENEEAVAGGDPVPVVDVEETGGKVATSETVAAGANTATAEGSKLAGRPANVEKAASSSMKPKPEVKKMPLSHHTAKAPTGMIDDAAKLKLEQAKEKA